jgi:YidC/Oxa1 family membrane protein insertase
MPFMMFFFFNNYASGLSLYYMISTFLSLVIVYVIKEYVIDEEKVKAQIEENKKKPKKQSRFQAKLQALMEQAEQQKRLQEEMKRKRRGKK